MFFFLFSSRVKTLLRDKDSVFWTLLFPILLATFFYIAFSSVMNKSEEFSPIPTAVVNNDSYKSNTYFSEFLKSVSSGDNPRLKLSVLDEKEADEKLENGQVSGVIIVSDTISLKVKKSGLNQSILKTLLDQYLQTEKTVQAVIESNPNAIGEGLLDALSDQNIYTKEITFSGAKPDTMLNYFYALIAMSCLYGSFWGMRNTTEIQADLSALGARRSIAPTHKLKAVSSDILAALVIHFSEILITVGYIAFVLGVDFGERWGYVVLTCLVGCFTSVSFGTFIGSAFRKSENFKTSILLGFSMTMSFLSGLMFGNMKIIIDQNVPILNMVNPAALITDAFYSLYIYEPLTRYFINIGLLCVISILFTIGSYLFLRRERYASI